MKKNFDFTIASEFQSKVDKSNGRAKTFIDNKNNELCFVKMIDFNPLGQLIANKIQKHYLGEEYASTDILANDGNYTYIVSKELKNFKTLTHVGDLCENKKIVGIENLYSVMFLLRHFEIEPNNLGVVVKDDRCIATKIDGDEALQIAFHLHKTNFSDNTAHYFNYYNYIEASYHCVHRYKVSKDKSVISMGLWRENQMVKDVEFELKFNIDTIDDNLMEKITTQTRDKDYVLLTNADMLKLGYKHPDCSYEKKHNPINTYELLNSIEKIVNTDSSIFSKIISYAVEEIKPYYCFEGIDYGINSLVCKFDSYKKYSDIRKYSDLYTIKEVKDVYFANLENNQKKMKFFYNTLKKHQDIEKCYDVAYRGKLLNNLLLNHSDIHIFKNLRDNLAEHTPFEKAENFNVLFEKENLDIESTIWGKYAIEEWNVKFRTTEILKTIKESFNSLLGVKNSKTDCASIVEEAPMQLRVIEILKQIKCSFTNMVDISATTLQFTNMRQVEVLEKLQKSSPHYKMMSEEVESIHYDCGNGISTDDIKIIKKVVSNTIKIALQANSSCDPFKEVTDCMQFDNNDIITPWGI